MAGSGPEGRIIEKDVLAYAASQPAATRWPASWAQELGVSLGQVAVPGERVTAAQVRAGGAPVASAAPIAAPTGHARPHAPRRGADHAAGRRARYHRRPHGDLGQYHGARTLQSVVDATDLVALREQLKDAWPKSWL